MTGQKQKNSSENQKSDKLSHSWFVSLLKIKEPQ